MSAALLSMSFFGSAFACTQLHGRTSLDQWIVICGAANGAASVFDALPDDLALHRQTSMSHLSRFAAENGVRSLEFEPLFERGLTEGQRLVSSRSGLFAPRKGSLLKGFHNDKSIHYADVQRALGMQHRPS